MKVMFVWKKEGVKLSLEMANLALEEMQRAVDMSNWKDVVPKAQATQEAQVLRVASLAQAHLVAVQALAHRVQQVQRNNN